MKLSLTARYAAHAMVFLADRRETGPASGRLIAEACGMPAGYVMRVLKGLARAGLLRSIRGPHGGFWIARDPHRITLLDIVEAVEGPLQPNVPVRPRDTLANRLERAYERATEQFRQRFRRERLSDLLGTRWAARSGDRARQRA